MPKKEFSFSCNFCYIWQTTQLEMSGNIIVMFGGLLIKLGQVTFVPVGGRRKGSKNWSAG